MAKKQTRRSISVTGRSYERLRAWCKARNLSMSEFVEGRITEALKGAPAVETPPVKPPQAPMPVPAPAPPVKSDGPSCACCGRPSEIGPPVYDIQLCGRCIACVPRLELRGENCPGPRRARVKLVRESAERIATEKETTCSTTSPRTAEALAASATPAASSSNATAAPAQAAVTAPATTSPSSTSTSAARPAARRPSPAPVHPIQARRLKGKPLCEKCHRIIGASGEHSCGGAEARFRSPANDFGAHGVGRAGVRESDPLIERARAEVLLAHPVRQIDPATAELELRQAARERSKRIGPTRLETDRPTSAPPPRAPSNVHLNF